MNGVALRTATEDDIAAVAALHMLSWRGAYRGVMPDALLESRDLEGATAAWRSTMKSYPGNVTVAVDFAGLLVGFCCAGTAVDAVRNAPFEFEIYGLHVSPISQGQGVGTALLQNALARMSRLGLAGAIVWTLKELIQSRRFYEKHGGKVVKTGVWESGGYELDEVAYGWPAGSEAHLATAGSRLAS